MTASTGHAGRRWRVLITVVVVVFGGLAVPTPATAAATGTANAAVSPTTVTTGADTTVTVSMDVTGVNTGDGTVGATVTLSAPDAVDLSGASVTRSSAGPNASITSEDIDAAAGTITLEWSDASGVGSEAVTVEVELADVVVGRTGTYQLRADVDADATGGSELSGVLVDSLSAVATDSDRSLEDERARVFLGEQDVDVTGLTGSNPAGEKQAFHGTSGDAEGGVATAANPVAVDVTGAHGFVEGGYNLSTAGGDTALVVSRPQVTELTVYSGSGTTGADVTNGSVPAETETLSVAASYTFAEAENLSVSVVDESGLDVTKTLTTDATLSASGSSLTLDTSELGVGEYTVTAEGADDLDSSTRAVTFRVRPAEKVISLSKTRVTRGERTVASVAGAPGAVGYVRLAGDDLETGTTVDAETARAVFEETEGVRADASKETIYAAVQLDDDGLANVRLLTEHLDEGQITVELAPSVAADSTDEIPLHVDERTVSVTDTPRQIATGETTTLSGQAAESETVKLYAYVGGSYAPLYADASKGTLAEATVGSDGSWETDVDASEVLDRTGSYRIVAVADPGSTHLGSTRTLDPETFRTIEPRGAVAVEVIEATVSLSSSRTEIAATGSDEVSISGSAVGQGETVRRYRIDPRGTVTAETLTVENGTFSETLEGIDRVGPHETVVVARGRDGQFAYADGSGPSTDGLVSDAALPDQALEAIRDAYSGPGVDDQLRTTTVSAERPALSVDVSSGDELPAGDVVVAGTSNREDGTTVVVELVDADGTASVFETTSVENGTWNTTLYLRESVGPSRLVVTDGASTESVAVRIGGSTVSTATAANQARADASTPVSETRTPRASSQETTVAESSETGMGTGTGTSAATGDGTSNEGTQTRTSAPGFGVLTALLGVLLAGTLLGRDD